MFSTLLSIIDSINLESKKYPAYIEQIGSRTPLYRFFNTQTGTRFYTAAEVEKNSIFASLPSFNFEGTAYWVDPAMG